MIDKDKEQIKENNVYVLNQFRKGAELSKTTQEQTWFPPRGVFDKEKGRMVAINAAPVDVQQADTKPVRHLRLVKDDEC